MTPGTGARALAAEGRRFAIATPHAAATRAGVEAFEAGGSAVDAALAAATTLTVVYPHMCHVGGDLLALVAHPDGPVDAINASGAAAAAIDVQALRRVGPRMPAYGPLTVDVPGVASGWAALAERGRLGLPRALEPAIALAREGVRLAPDVAASLAWAAERLAADPGFAEVFFRDGRPLEEGETLVQDALAGTLETMAAEGPTALYGGGVGERFVEGLRRLGSPLALEDLAAHEPEIGPPLVGGFRDLEALVVPPNSQGFVLLEILALADRLGLDPDPWGRDAGMLARAFDAASRDRDAHLADPGPAAVPVEDLLDGSRLDTLAEDLRAGRAPAPVAGLRPAAGDTIALVAADAEGHAVSLIQSLFDGFGSGILEPSTGMICHSRGSAFSLDPASPNVLEGGKRPAHSLMPVLYRREGRAAAVGGTMGGWAQPQINAQVQLRSLAAGELPAEALGAARWALGDTFRSPGTRHADLEPGVPQATADALAAAGFEPRRLGRGDVLGHAHLIRVAADGTFEAGTDPRADGEAAAG